MTVIELDQDNADTFAYYVGEDMAENLEREFYRGVLVLSDDEEELLAGMVWQYLNFEEEKDTQSEIEWIKVSQASAAEEMFALYTTSIAKEGAKKSSFVIPVIDNDKEIAALKAAGFREILTEGDDIVVDLATLSSLPIMKNRRIPDGIGSLSEVTLRKYRKVISKCISYGRKGVCEDLSYLSMDWFDQEISSYCERDDAISGLLLFHRHPSGIFSLQLMVALHKNSQQDLIGMVKNSIMIMQSSYPPDTKVLLDRHNKAALLLAVKLLPKGFGVPVYSGSRDE